MGRTFYFLFIFILAVFLWGRVGYAESDFKVSKSDSLDYFTWVEDPACLLSQIQAPVIKLCVQGWGSLEKAKTMAAKSLQLWLEASDSISGKGIPKIEFSCEQPHGYVRVYQGWGRESASPGIINVYDQSYFGSYLHEFGHAFACLGDTYINGTAGMCYPGQAHSVMCDGLLREDLSADDVEGLSYQIDRWRKLQWLPRKSFTRH